MPWASTARPHRLALQLIACPFCVLQRTIAQCLQPVFLQNLMGERVMVRATMHSRDQRSWGRRRCVMQPRVRGGGCVARDPATDLRILGFADRKKQSAPSNVFDEAPLKGDVCFPAGWMIQLRRAMLGHCWRISHDQPVRYRYNAVITSAAGKA